jgi:glycosyltransferase involved in cell wall biosynthesis
MAVPSPDLREEWAFLGDRVLVVSPFPPARDGIARYAVQLIDALGGERSFRRLGTPEGGGERTRALHRGVRALALLGDARGYDDILVHYHPEYYIRGGAISRLACYASWALVVRMRNVIFVIHEPDEPGKAKASRRWFGAEERLRRLLWARAARLVFHTEWERKRFAERFPPRRRRQDVVVRHGAFFSTAVDVPREHARARLGLATDRAIFVIIGFLSRENPDKGYDRAIQALGEAGDARAQLHIVGSPIRTGRVTDLLVAELRQTARERPDVHLHEGFVGDEDFDLWIRAADAVLTPYRSASSSGVAVRAHLLGTRVITSGVGGLAEQVEAGDIVARSDAELASAIRRVSAEVEG